MATYANDYVFGRASEDANRTVLENHLSTTLYSQARHDLFDYVDNNSTVYVELKTRRIPHNQYATAIIGENKVNACTDPEKQYWFAYRYTDGLYIIKYNKTLFDTFERNEEFVRGRRPDSTNNASRVVMIPTSLLTRV